MKSEIVNDELKILLNSVNFPFLKDDMKTKTYLGCINNIQIFYEQKYSPPLHLLRHDNQNKIDQLQK